MALVLHNGRDSPIPTTVHAIGRFGKYKDEKPVAIRQADVKGDVVDALRRKRELLLGMPPENAKDVIEFHEYLNVFEALALAKKEGRIIVPNIIHDRILTETNDMRYISENFPVWTGTIVIYAGPGKPFGEKVVYGWEDGNVPYSISFRIPTRFRGKIDCALVVEHPDFDLAVSGKNTYELIADESRLHLLERFPVKDGESSYEKLYRLPTACKIGNNSEPSRYLWRSQADYIGLVARGYDDYGDGYDGRGVYLYNRASSGLGVALF